MSEAHTAGPWRVSGRQSIRGPEGEYIAKTNWANGIANARLIATSPEMLAELQEILAWARLERAPLRDQEIESIKRVIAKATEAQ